MSKVLVIRGADFYDNKVTEIEILNPVPCTSLSLSETELSMTSVGSTFTLVATVTPLNTTDGLVWRSSNEDAVKVSGGVITQQGVGVATITVRCGSFTAQCNVTCTHVINANTGLFYTNGYGITGPNLSATPPNTSVYTSAESKHRVYADFSEYTSNPSGQYRAFAIKPTSGVGYYKNAIQIPKGATLLSLTAPSGFNLGHIAFENSHLESGYYTDRVAYAAVTQYNTSISLPWSIDLTDLPEGTDSFVFAIRSGSSAAAETITGDVTLTFS